MIIIRALGVTGNELTCINFRDPVCNVFCLGCVSVTLTSTVCSPELVSLVFALDQSFSNFSLSVIKGS